MPWKHLPHRGRMESLPICQNNHPGTVMKLLVAISLWLIAVPGWAANLIVKNGNTIVVDGIEYRLDGIDAPEVDQPCLDEKGAVWPCGVEARDRLIRAIGKRPVHCADKSADPGNPRRRIGICTVDSTPLPLSRWLVSEGLAVSLDSHASGRLLADQMEAKKERRGMWGGCFVAPQDFRRWNKSTATLQGAACDRVPRTLLFPDEPKMPAGCQIKGKLATRAKLQGYVGIYHTEGCRSYARTKKNERWFCTEPEAKDAGFRKSLTC